MAKLGSKKNPLILRVADDSDIDRVASVCHDNGWHFILGIEPNMEEDLSDLARKLTPPFEHLEIKIGRNERCDCGSGKKYKKCCGGA